MDERGTKRSEDRPGETEPPEDAGRPAPPRAETPPRPVRDPGLPEPEGLYDPGREKDACGVGIIADMSNRPSHAIVSQGLSILKNLAHRGAVGADPRMGDGCGILVQIADRFFREECASLGIDLPEPGHYGVGHLFLPRDKAGRKIVQKIVERTIRAEGLTLLGWRDVPVDNADLGPSVKATEPLHRQIFIGKGKGMDSQETFERRLFLARKVISNASTT
jgi:glutamate synthase (NADPH/NADH) large chain